MLIITIIIFSVIGFIEVPSLLENGKRKELIIYIILFAAAFILSTLLALGIDIPAPSKFIESMIKSLGLIQS